MGDVKVKTVAAAHTPKVRSTVRRRLPAHDMAKPKSAAVHLLQPALKVGAANDPLEHEAETNAERV